MDFMRKLALTVTLACQANFDELSFILDVIEGTDFRSLPTKLRRRACRMNDQSPGLIGDGGYLVYYDAV